MPIQSKAAINLTQAQLETIHQTALALASRVGFRYTGEHLPALLAGREGFAVRNKRIYPSVERIEAYLASHRQRHNDPPTDPASPPIIYATDRPLYIVADDDISLRPVTERDAIEGAKLVDVLYARGVRGGTIGLPADLPPWLAPLEQVRIGARYSRSGGSTSHGFTDWHTRYLEELMRAQGQPFGLSVWMPSPFRLEGNELDIVLAMAGHFDSLGVGSMPLMGITAPMDEIQTWTQALAETIGAATILWELFPEVPVDFFPHPKPANMSTGGYGLGLPEMHLMDVLKSAILPFYGLQPPWGKSAAQGAAVHGPQSQMERAFAYLIGYLHGYRAFDMAGALAGGDVFSPVQLLWDVETLSWAERFARGAGWDGVFDDLERWIDIASEGGIFAEDPDEVARMRQLYRPSHFFPSTIVAQHLDHPRDAIAEARADIKQLIDAHDYEADPALLREIDRIIEHARMHPPA